MELTRWVSLIFRRLGPPNLFYAQGELRMYYDSKSDLDELKFSIDRTWTDGECLRTVPNETCCLLLCKGSNLRQA